MAKKKTSKRKKVGNVEEVNESTIEVESKSTSPPEGELSTSFNHPEEATEVETSGPEVKIDTEEEKIKSEIKGIIAGEIKNLKGDISFEDFYKAIRGLDFFVSRSDECLEKGCDNPATTWGHCRLHYISNWADIKKKQALLKTGKLQDHIQALVEKHSSKFIEHILGDIINERSFFSALKELGIGGIEEFDEVSEDEADDDHDRDIAYETKVTVRPSFDED